MCVSFSYDMAEKMRADVVQNIQVCHRQHRYASIYMYLYMPCALCFMQDYLTTKLQLIVESSTPKVLRSSRVDKEGEGKRG